MTIAAISKVTTKVAICSYVNKIQLTSTIAEYKLVVAYNAPNTIIVTNTIGLPINPSKTKVDT